MKTLTSPSALRVTNSSVPDNTSLLPHFDQRLDTIASVPDTPATMRHVEPQDIIAERLTLCTGEEMPPTAEQHQTAAIITRALRNKIAKKAY